MTKKYTYLINEKSKPLSVEKIEGESFKDAANKFCDQMKLYENELIVEFQIKNEINNEIKFFNIYFHSPPSKISRACSPPDFSKKNMIKMSNKCSQS